MQENFGLIFRTLLVGLAQNLSGIELTILHREQIRVIRIGRFER